VKGLHGGGAVTGVRSSALTGTGARAFERPGKTDRFSGVNRDTGVLVTEHRGDIGVSTIFVSFHELRASVGVDYSGVGGRDSHVRGGGSGTGVEGHARVSRRATGTRTTDDGVPGSRELAEAGSSMRSHQGFDALKVGRRDDQTSSGGGEIVEVVLLHVVEDATDEFHALAGIAGLGGQALE